MKFKKHQLIEKAAPWVVVFSMLILWQLSIWIFSPQPFILPSPALVYSALLDYREPIIAHAIFTLTNTLIGFAIGIVVGGLLGIFMARRGSSMRAFIPC